MGTVTAILLNPNLWTILMTVVSGVLGSKWWLAKKAELQARKDVVSVGADLADRLAHDVVSKVETEVVQPYKDSTGLIKLDQTGQDMAQSVAEERLKSVLTSTGSSFLQQLAPALITEIIRIAVARLHLLPTEQIPGDVAALIKAGDAAVLKK